jgi:hypothetical protein
MWKGRTAGWVSIVCTPPVERLGVISPAALFNKGSLLPS